MLNRVEQTEYSGATIPLSIHRSTIKVGIGQMSRLNARSI